VSTGSHDCPHEVVHVDELDVFPINNGEFVWRPIPRRLGISAFGTNPYTGNKGERVIQEHHERDRHEEMYVVLSGRATFTLGDEQLAIVHLAAGRLPGSARVVGAHGHTQRAADRLRPRSCPATPPRSGSPSPGRAELRPEIDGGVLQGATYAIGRSDSSYKRTARSRNSSEYFLGLAIVGASPSPQDRAWRRSLHETQGPSHRHEHRPGDVAFVADTCQGPLEFRIASHMGAGFHVRAGLRSFDRML
jgi:hypothetical protein